MIRNEINYQVVALESLVIRRHSSMTCLFKCFLMRKLSIFFLALIQIQSFSTYAQTKKETQDWIASKLQMTLSSQMYWSPDATNHRVNWERTRTPSLEYINNDTLCIKLINTYSNDNLLKEPSLRDNHNCDCAICESYRKNTIYNPLVSYAYIPLADIDTVFLQESGQLGYGWSYWRGLSYPDVYLINIVCKSTSIQYALGSTGRERYIILTAKLGMEKDLWNRLQKAFLHLKSLYPPKKEIFYP